MARFEDAVLGADGRRRCAWSVTSPEYIAYHDDEWGFPLTDERRLFEKICLEGFQAGLSWITILRRREGFRGAFDDFDASKIAEYGEADIARLLADERIIRHRGKIEATIGNARALLALDTPLVGLVWSFAPQAGTRKRPASFVDVPAVTPESTALSKELRRRGFRFVGPTTMYALMQSAGLVDDHVEGCWRAG
ncbi:DNA-3-methyladenine glycosylase I [Gryllotalpicola reticulitermitis]|uniref:DNA-3-methyladenine glycosylase I n=1 Tax=Gryllotalpicola reticulitermitis TaxID=1184153 RepID=A0ABV8Q6M0_9MICO